MGELDYVSGLDLARMIRHREISAAEVVDSFLAAIDSRNALVNAFVHVIGDEARSAARRADEALARGDLVGPLHGVPLAIKDLFDFKAGVPASLGSRVFRDFVPSESCSYVQRLEDAGAIVVGKTNTPELGFKGTTDNGLFGSTKSPFDLSANAGGSSGGSAAAVAEGLVPLSQGSDGGGSVRIPAAMCGVFGFKPSFGRIAVVTRPNLFTKDTPFLHPGPITRTVEDAALMLDVMSGPDPLDPFSLPAWDGSFLREASRGIEGMQIGYSADLGGYPVEPAVLKVVESALSAFEACGATIVPVTIDLPYPQEELSALWHRLIGRTYVDFVNSCEEQRIDLLGQHADELDPDLLPLIEAALRASARQASKDSIMRSRVFEAINDSLRAFPLLVAPVLSVARVADGPDGRTVGPRQVGDVDVDPLIGWCLTYLFNFTGHPAASVPAGLTDEGHPVGIQLVGARGRDDLVLRASSAFAEVRPWQDTYPNRRGLHR
jgi:Asp-tRNA(Asn)/Glu-tRNA(Gln) amidotransferase A subunit family amidase